MTREAKNVAASVRARLLAGAKGRGEEFSLTLQRYAAERFLYRLGRSMFSDRFVLKGAMLFSLWKDVYRATQDVDLAGYGPDDPDSLREAFRLICEIPCPEDGVRFDPGSVRLSEILEKDEYAGWRARILGDLDGMRLTLYVDVGFGDVILPPAQVEDYPVLLDAPAPRIRAYPREAVVAEKFHALVKHGMRNSRMKDFYDLFVMASRFGFSGATLCASIRATFSTRPGSPFPEATPTGLTAEFYATFEKADQWRGHLAKTRLREAPEDFEAVGNTIRAFLGPVVDALAAGEQHEKHWNAGGGWR